MDLSAIRAQARAMRGQVTGFTSLFLVPIIYTILMALRASFDGSVYTSDELDEAVHTALNGSIFPMVMGFVLTIFAASIAFTLIDVLRRKRQEVTFKDSLRAFDGAVFGKVLATTIVKQIYLFLWGIIAGIGLTICLASGLVMLGILLSQTGIVEPSLSDSLYATIGVLFFITILGIIVLIAGLAIYIPQYYAYSQVEYILYEQLQNGDYSGPRQVIRQSRQMMKGFKGNRFILDVTFWGWYLLVYLTFGFAGIYVIPYASAAKAIFYEQLKKEYTKRQESLKEAQSQLFES